MVIKMKPLLTIIGNNIYFVFQDKYFPNKQNITIQSFIKESDIDINLRKKIISLFNENNYIAKNSERYKNYISKFSVYIDDLKVNNKNYFFHCYIIPKEVNIKNINFEENDSIEEKKLKIDFIEKKSVSLFKEYAKNIVPKNKEFKSLREAKGDSFLDLDLNYYNKKLKSLYGMLFSNNLHHIHKVISSSKISGELIVKENKKNNNPLKNIQIIKELRQSDLILFVRTLLDFLVKNKLAIYVNQKNYIKTKKLIKNIENRLNEISNNNYSFIKIINKKEMQNFFKNYETKKEIIKNKDIFNVFKDIYFNYIKTGKYQFKTIDLSLFLEKSVDLKLINENKEKNIYKGIETEKKIKKINKQTNNFDSYLPNVYFSNGDTFGLYPDNLICDKNNEVLEIIDAKYYLYKDLIKKPDLFFKMYAYKVAFENNQNKIKLKFIIPEILTIDYEKEKNVKIELNKKPLFKILSTHNLIDGTGLEIYNINIFNKKNS